MEYLKQFIDICLHLDQHLNSLVASAGNWTYVLMIAIIFAETGLVIMPFLPGDSLLFALGALTSTADAYLSWTVLFISLTLAAIIGDAVNYAIGKYVGPKIFNRADSFLFNKKHLKQAEDFYKKHGGKAIVLARFVPIVRTFAPFVAGIGEMSYSRFAMYNILGAIVWVGGFLTLGKIFGNLPAVKTNFHIVIVAIIIISVIPMVIEFWRARKENQKMAV
jgi:membrane-associated protein